MPKTIERRMLPISELHPFEGNPRHISDEAKAGLRTSIERFGLVQEIVVSRRTGRVVGGHQRLDALREMGEAEAPVALVDLTEDEEKALNVALNNPKLQGEFTADLLGLLEGVSAEALDGLRTDDLAEALQRELAKAEEKARRKFEIETVVVQPPPETVWVLVAVPSARYHEVADHLDAVSKVEGVVFDKVLRGGGKRE